MDEAKIRLSPLEKDLVLNAGWILTKNAVLEKGMLLLGRLQALYQERLMAIKGLPPEVCSSSPKISRGENYGGLPYLVLDHPRCFGKEDIFVIRTLFWWGNFFSITLQLSGSYKKSAEEKIIRSYASLAENGYAVCIATDPWQHHFEKDNYLLLSGIGPAAFEKIIRDTSFIKLAVKTELQRWDEIEEIFPVYFGQLMELTSV